MIHAVSCLLGCLCEPSNDNDQSSVTSYALLHHDLFYVLTLLHSFRHEDMLVFRTLCLRAGLTSF